jgi:O-methyltransferase
VSIRNSIARRMTALGKKISTDYRGLRSDIPELSEADEALLGKVRGLSLTSPIAQWEFIRAIRYVEARGIPGDIVECGVWRGGHLALAGLMRRELGFNRRIYAYDTFAGMTAPTEFDQKAVVEVDTVAKFEALDREGHNEWCYASLEDVQQNFARLAGADAELLTIKGPVQETLTDPGNLPERIAILRLDTDFYDSTKIEMETLYPRLAPGGVLIIDDYGEWAGARKAVDEYFDGQFVWLQRVTHTVRLMIKN